MKKEIKTYINVCDRCEKDVDGYTENCDFCKKEFCNSCSTNNLYWINGFGPVKSLRYCNSCLLAAEGSEIKIKIDTVKKLFSACGTMFQRKSTEFYKWQSELENALKDDVERVMKS